MSGQAQTRITSRFILEKFCTVQLITFIKFCMSAVSICCPDRLVRIREEWNEKGEGDRKR
jgi:hypothetical protein